MKNLTLSFRLFFISLFLTFIPLGAKHKAFQDTDIYESFDVIINKGNLLIINDQFEQALFYFDHVINCQSTSLSTNPDPVLVARALWGRTLSYAFLGKKEEFYMDLYALGEILKLDEKCICDTSHDFPKAVNDEFFEYSLMPLHFLLCDAYCENTIDNMASFMKAMCNIIKDIGIKTTLDLFIDGMRDKAKNCCRAGGFWQQCVDPMVKIAEKWKAFGIPNDPYWD